MRNKKILTFITLTILISIVLGCTPEPIVEEIVSEVEVSPIVEESDFALHGNLNVELYDCDEDNNPILIDDGPYDGYRWGNMRPMAWVPGVITQKSYEMELPEVFSGKLGAKYVPETLGADKYLEGYLGAVELPLCSALGESVWINTGGGFEGPYLVAACPDLLNTYGQIVHEEDVIKISFEVALDWGMAYLWQTEHVKRLGDRHVHKTVKEAMKATDDVIRAGWHYTQIDNVVVSLIPPEEINSEPIDLKEYFMERVRFQIGG